MTTRQSIPKKSSEKKLLKIIDLASPEKNAISTGPFGKEIPTKNFVDKGIPLIRGKNLKNCIVKQ